MLHAVLLLCTVLSSEARKNVLLMISDDLRPELSVYNQTTAHTPNIAKFAKRALRFDRAYCQIAVCAPSRIALLSGRRPETTKVWNFIDWFRNNTAGAESWKTLPEYFMAHGYNSLGFGKTFHGCSTEIVPCPLPAPPNAGPCVYPAHNVSLSGMGYCDLERSWSTEVLPYLPFKLEHCPNGAQFCRVDDETRIFDHNLTLAAINGISVAAKLDKPWFVAVGFKKPHAPWGVPSRFFDQWNPKQLQTATHSLAAAGVPDVALIHDFPVVLANGSNYTWQPKGPAVPTEVAQLLRQAYYAAVSFVDEQVGKVLGALDAMDLTDQTIVVFVADHGYHLGEHGEWEKKAAFELTMRVPLLISAPHLPASHGRSTRGLVDLVDIYPTLTDLAGLPPPVNEPFIPQDAVSALHLFNAPAELPPAAPGRADSGVVATAADAMETAAAAAASASASASSAAGKRSRSRAGGRTASFSQYPRCGGAGPAVEQGSCNSIPKENFQYMGFTVRTAEWRYTAWLKWNGTTLNGDWKSAESTAPYAEELYDHAADDGTDFNAYENVNLVGSGVPPSPAVEAARSGLLTLLATRFS